MLQCVLTSAFKTATFSEVAGLVDCALGYGDVNALANAVSRSRWSVLHRHCQQLRVHPLQFSLPSEVRELIAAVCEFAVCRGRPVKAALLHSATLDGAAAPPRKRSRPSGRERASKRRAGLAPHAPEKPTPNCSQADLRGVGAAGGAVPRCLLP